MRLNNIRLLVTNFDETFLFYRDILGFKVTWGNLGENYAHFQTGDAGELSIFSRKIMAEVMKTTNLPFQSAAQDKVAVIFSVPDVDEFYHSLQSKGVKFENTPTDQPDWGIRVTHLRDPEGNLLEFIMDLARD